MIGGLLLYLAITLPLYVAFEDGVSIGRHILEYLVDAIFIVDVVLSFMTGFRDYEQGGAVVTNLGVIAKRYAKGWLWLDLVASVPWEAIESAVGEA